MARLCGLFREPLQNPFAYHASSPLVPASSYVAVLTSAILLAGCATYRSVGRGRPDGQSTVMAKAGRNSTAKVPSEDVSEPAGEPPIQFAAYESSEPAAEIASPSTDATSEQLPPAVLPPLEPLSVASETLSLERVVESVQRHYPVIRVAAAGRGVAAGEALAALGAFDHKLKASTENQALGFYENYRHQAGFERNTFWGGRLFSGYRVGRGDFEPWYLERETNAGGEFKAGLVVPLAQNRWIDPNRAALWQAQVARNLVEPEIQAEIIFAVRDASFLYWEWVAAGEAYRIAQSLLDIAAERDAGLRRQVESGDQPEIVLTDNRRLIVSREAKLIDAERKLEQSAIKLSLFLRSPVGEPWIPNRELLPKRFPEMPAPLDAPSPAADIELALRTRPELAALNLLRRKTEIELEQANNLSRPEVNATLLSSQDVGAPTKAIRDKSPLVLEAGLTLSVPLERRKALGKIRATEAKLTQIRIKSQFASEKIATEVRGARVALEASKQRARRMNESLELALRMEAAEQRAFELGDSNLLNVNLREQQRADAALDLVDAQLAYFLAEAEFDAARGVPFIAPP